MEPAFCNKVVSCLAVVLKQKTKKKNGSENADKARPGWNQLY
jgi:hypothetical protein